MTKKFVTLTNDQIRTGQILSDKAKYHLAAYEALKAVELEYQAQLREIHGTGPEYLVLDYLQGLEAGESVDVIDEVPAEQNIELSK